MNILLTLLSALLLSFPWMGITSFPLLFGLVPLLIVQQRTAGKRFWLYTILMSVTWNIITSWWIVNAVVVGLIAATIVHTTLITIILQLYNLAQQKARRALAYTILVCGWVAFEYLYLNGEISFPWLVVGNGFANNIKLIQWYEYLGTLGGSLWAMVCNVLFLNLYNAFARYRQRKISKNTLYYHSVVSLAFVVVPIILSISIFNRYHETENPVTITITQPNIDPYLEKFNGMTQAQQLNSILTLSKEAPTNVSFIIAPETAIDDNLWVSQLDNHHSVGQIKTFLENTYPNTQMITGATLYQHYPPTPENQSPPTTTARKKGDGYYDVYNSAIGVTTDKQTEVYHKSKLVIGAEMTPYHEYLGGISKLLSIDLGGISGMFGTQDQRSVFTNNGTSIGVAICYESVYGEFFSEFIRQGAEVMCVITNDGWWGDTFGHRQHFSYSRLRAIETRRSIARSANTGISGFINQRGEVTDSLGWDQRGTITATINKNTATTFFTRFGDTPGRICSYVFVLSVLYLIAYIRKKKDYLV